MDQVIARRMWQVGEPVHAVIYFGPEARTATSALGVPDGWMSYFGCRAAPLGAVSAAAATAIFYNLAPSMVAAAIPDVWRYASPQQLLQARIAAVDAVLRRALGAAVHGPDLRRAAELAVVAAAAVIDCGRPMAAANAALPMPEEPHLALWQSLTTLREHRGDGHIAVLTAAEIEPCEANVLLSATGRAPETNLKRYHKWTDHDWATAVRRLSRKGWLTEDGTLTADGRSARERIETDTDQLASAPYRTLGADRTAELYDRLYPLADAVISSGAVKVPNPAGLRWPPAGEPGDCLGTS